MYEQLLCMYDLESQIYISNATNNKPVRIDIKVVFPAPLCPRRAVIWPL